MLSFAKQLKSEVNNIEIESENAFLYAIIKCAGKIGFEGESVSIEINGISNNHARKVTKIIKKRNILDYVCHQKKVRNWRGYSEQFFFNINDGEKLLTELNYITNGKIVDPKITFQKNLNSEKATREYIRFFFIINGSINDPIKTAQYHLEIVHVQKSYLVEIKDLLNQLNMFPRISSREGTYILYTNKSDEIANFLILIEAAESLFKFEDLRIMRDLKKVNNRINNAEIANESKKIERSQVQIGKINKLKKENKFDELSEITKKVYELVLENKELSLQELSEMSDIKKATINYHLAKLKNKE